jgi:hypothetical protein
MYLGEVTTKSRSEFNGRLHLKHQDALVDRDMDNKTYIPLDLPSVKMAKLGQMQHVFLPFQNSNLCPVAALTNLVRIVPAGPLDPLFSWRDDRGSIQPMLKQKVK